MTIKVKPKMHGLDIKSDWKPNEQGQLIMRVRIKRWYMPIFLAKNLHKYGLPLKYWPLIYWRHYTGYVKREASHE